MNLEVRTQTHKPDQTKINIYRFDMAKSAAQLLYGPVLVSICLQYWLKLLLNTCIFFCKSISYFVVKWAFQIQAQKNKAWL